MERCIGSSRNGQKSIADDLAGGRACLRLRTEVRAMKAKIYAFSVVVLFINSIGWAQSGTTAELSKYLFAPDLVFKYRDTIKLPDPVVAQIKDEAYRVDKELSDLRWKLQDATTRFEKSVSRDRVEGQDAKMATSSFDEILELERLIKTAQLRLLIFTKNLLSPEQQKALRYASQQK
jgi:hypothetical protein